MNIDKIASNLRINSNGLYVSQYHRNLSYPNEGHGLCLQIEEKSFWFRHRNKVISYLVKKFAPNEAFFDIGGGNGFVSLALQKEGIQTILIEPGVQGALNAKKRGLENVICATFEDAGFKEGSLASVGLFDVLEHIEDDHTFLQDISNLQKSGSYIFITVPAYNWLWSDEDDFAGHFRRHTLRSISKLLENCGYEISFKTYLFAQLVLPIFLIRSIPYRLGFKRKPNNLETLQKEHATKSGFFSKLNKSYLNQELSLIKAGKRIAFGSSCLVVGKKI